MTGRARGRARGRTKTPVAAAATQETRKPGGGAEGAGQPTAGVGRGGRGRGGTATAPAQQKPPPQATQQPAPQPPALEEALRPLRNQQQVTENMGRMTFEPVVVPAPAQVPPASSAVTPGVTASSAGGRGRGAVEPVTKPEHITDKRGTSGYEIQVVSNYLTIKNRPNCALYQYNVTFSPELESKKLRVALLYSYTGIGQTKAFDGGTLYLPIKLPDLVTTFTVKTKRDETVEISITLTNELGSNSPICLQLYNVILRR